jgi:hypothetical protein
VRAFLLLVPTLGAAVYACAGTDATTTGYTPVTGVLVRAESLVSSLGCGMRDAQIFKYAAVVTQGTTTITGGLYDCFADAKFANLQPGPDGTLSFTVQIYAFSQASYAAQNAGGVLDAAAADWSRLQAFKPTYKTTCTATQQQNVEVLAVCAPLQKGDPATISVDTTSFARADGGTIACGDYKSVKPFFRASDQPDELPPVDCPAPVVLSPAQAPATYAIDLQLLDPTGVSVVGTVHCGATTTPGLEAKAACDPVL